MGTDSCVIPPLVGIHVLPLLRNNSHTGWENIWMARRFSYVPKRLNYHPLSCIPIKECQKLSRANNYFTKRQLLRTGANYPGRDPDAQQMIFYFSMRTYAWMAPLNSKDYDRESLHSINSMIRPTWIETFASNKLSVTPMPTIVPTYQ